jgi:hypothetical protein
MERVLSARKAHSGACVDGDVPNPLKLLYAPVYSTVGFESLPRLIELRPPFWAIDTQVQHQDQGDIGSIGVHVKLKSRFVANELKSWFQELAGALHAQKVVELRDDQSHESLGNHQSAETRPNSTMSLINPPDFSSSEW